MISIRVLPRPRADRSLPYRSLLASTPGWLPAGLVRRDAGVTARDPFAAMPTAGSRLCFGYGFIGSDGRLPNLIRKFGGKTVPGNRRRLGRANALGECAGGGQD